MPELRRDVEALIKRSRAKYHKKLTAILNTHNIENDSDTPDFILAQYLEDCLAAFAAATRARERWYSEKAPKVEQ